MVCSLTVTLCKERRQSSCMWMVRGAMAISCLLQFSAAVLGILRAGRRQCCGLGSACCFCLLSYSICLPAEAQQASRLTCSLVSPAHTSPPHVIGRHFAGIDGLSGASLAVIPRLYRSINNPYACLQLHADAQEAKEEAAMLQQVAAAAASAREREGELRKTLAEKEQ